MEQDLGLDWIYLVSANLTLTVGLFIKQNKNKQMAYVSS